MENLGYIVLSLFLATFVLMWVRQRSQATINLLSYEEERSILEKACCNLQSLIDTNLEECRDARLTAEINLEKPVLVDCMLYGQFKGFAAKVSVNRNGELRAPDKIDDRVLFRCERDCILGAPQWVPLTKPLKYGIGYHGNHFIVLNMLGAPYIMKHGDHIEPQAQKSDLT